MPRFQPASIQTDLAGSVLTTAFLIGITRLDGAFLGLTTSNVDLTYAGTMTPPTPGLYEAMDSAAASTLRQSATTGVDNLDVAGVLESGRITDVDLLAGRYDGALLDLSLVSYNQQPLVDRLLLVTGTLGEVTFSEGQYQAEFRSLSARLQQKIGELTSATCRVRQVFDVQCFVGGMNFTGVYTAASFQQDNVAVTTVTSQQVIVFNSATGTGLIDYGRVLWRTGANAGLQLEVKKSKQLGSSQLQLTFVIPWSLTVNVGDTALIEQGCDRTFTTCVAKFQNAGNFRGEPALPGNHRVVRWGRR